MIRGWNGTTVFATVLCVQSIILCDMSLMSKVWTVRDDSVWFFAEGISNVSSDAGHRFSHSGDQTAQSLKNILWWWTVFRFSVQWDGWITCFSVVTRPKQWIQGNLISNALELSLGGFSLFCSCHNFTASFCLLFVWLNLSFSFAYCLIRQYVIYKHPL